MRDRCAFAEGFPQFDIFNIIYESICRVLPLNHTLKLLHIYMYLSLYTDLIVYMFIYMVYYLFWIMYPILSLSYGVYCTILFLWGVL